MMQIDSPNSNEELLSGGSEEGTPRVNLKQIAAGFLRHWWLVLVLPLLGLGLGWSLSRKLPRQYAASAVLQIDPGKNILSMEVVDEINMKDEAEVNNLAQRATSRPVLLRAIRTQRYHFNTEWIGQASPGSEEAEAAVLNRLQPMVVSAMRKGTRFVDVKASGEQSAFVAELANAVAQAAIEEMEADRGESNEEAAELLVREAERLRTRLKESELSLQAYKSENDAISLDEKKDLVLTTLKSIGEQYLQASAKRLQLETELEACKKGDLSELELLSLPTVANHPKVAASMVDISRLNGEMDVMRERYKSKHPKYVALERQIQSADDRLKTFLTEVVAILESTLQGVRSLELKLASQLKERENEALELEKLAVNYNSLRREMETDSAVFQSVLARLKEVDVEQSQDRPVLRFYQSAEAPKVPFSPNIPLILGGSAVGGLALAVALVMGLVMIDSKIRTVADAEQHFQLPILGVVGDEEDAAVSAPSGSSEEGEPKEAKVKRRRSYYYRQGNQESFRTLRNMVSLLGRKDATRFILITSAVPEEGKTFCSANLANSYAAQGTPTLIIDADLRRPALTRHFPSDKDTVGFTDVLLGHVELAAALRPADSSGGLYVLSSGSRVPNPGELLGNENHLSRFFKAVQETGFERVVFDSAPLLPVSDTLLLSRLVDTVLMVAACNKTPIAATQSALKRLKAVDVKVSGLILNRFRAHSVSGYYYSSYYYRGYYGETQKPVLESA